MAAYHFDIEADSTADALRTLTDLVAGEDLDLCTVSVVPGDTAGTWRAVVAEADERLRRVPLADMAPDVVTVPKAKPNRKAKR